MNDHPCNQDLGRLQQMLEEATSAGGSAETLAHFERAGELSLAGDSESDSLHEAWLAFTHLAQAADDSLPTVTVAMPASLALANPSGATSVLIRRAARRRWLGLVAATAATLLLAMSFARWVVHDNQSQDRGRGGHEPSLAQTKVPKQEHSPTARHDPHSPAVAAASRFSANRVPATSVPATGVPVKIATELKAPVEKAASESADAKTTTLAWDDSLETQISSMSRQIRDTEQNWQHRTDDLDLVQYNLDEVSDAVKNDEL